MSWRGGHAPSQRRKKPESDHHDSGPAPIASSRRRGAVLRSFANVQRVQGRVDDLIISRKGNVEAVVVGDTRTRTATQDRYVYPWRSGTADFDRNRYALPYEQAQINNLKPFNYRAFNIMEPTTRATGATGTGAAGGEQRLEQRARPARQEKG